MRFYFNTMYFGKGDWGWRRYGVSWKHKWFLGFTINRTSDNNPLYKGGPYDH